MVRIESAYVVVGCWLLALPAAAVHQAPSRAPDARAEIKNRDGQTVGRAELVDGPHGIILSLRLNATTSAGEHALHIHQTGTCQAPTFESAAGHFNQTGASHGVLSEKGPHVDYRTDPAGAAGDRVACGVIVKAS